MNKSLFTFILAVIFYFISIPLFAQELEPSEGMKTAQSILDQLNAGWALTVGMFVVELGLRLKKTETPQSLLYMISNVFKMISKGCDFLAKVLDGVIQRKK